MEDNNSEKDRFIRFQINEFLMERGLFKDGQPCLDGITMDDVFELSKMFLDYVWESERSFLGVGGWLLWIDSCLLEKFFNESKKHNGVRLSDVPELVSLNNDIQEFEAFSQKYLGYGRSENGCFENVTKSNDNKHCDLVTPEPDVDTMLNENKEPCLIKLFEAPPPCTFEPTDIEMVKKKKETNEDEFNMTMFCIALVALAVCSIIVYFHDELCLNGFLMGYYGIIMGIATVVLLVFGAKIICSRLHCFIKNIRERKVIKIINLQKLWN